MHINSFHMRATASGDIARLFGSSNNDSSKSDEMSKSHGHRHGMSDRAGSSRAMREAVNTIFDVLTSQNPNGMTAVTATRGDHTFTAVKGSGGADTISYANSDTSRVVSAYIDAGGGDDVISFASTSEGSNRIYGGDGNDAIGAAAPRIRTVDGGAGNDVISVAGERIGSVRGGSGDDTIAVAGKSVSRVSGGDGNDMISVTGSRVGRIYGGDGDDTIAVTADRAGWISGGAGNDNINLNGEGLVAFKAGDGQDTVTIADRTEFAIFGESWGDDVMTLDKANFTFENGALTVSFDGRDETITILSGGGDMKLEMTSDRTFVVTPG
jgi:Ca2+-binding RTX toxin-like protein